MLAGRLLPCPLCGLTREGAGQAKQIGAARTLPEHRRRTAELLQRAQKPPRQTPPPLAKEEVVVLWKAWLEGGRTFLQLANSPQPPTHPQCKE